MNCITQMPLRCSNLPLMLGVTICCHMTGSRVPGSTFVGTSFTMGFVMAACRPLHDNMQGDLPELSAAMQHVGVLSAS